jgi:hypothetical protein
MRCSTNSALEIQSQRLPEHSFGVFGTTKGKRNWRTSPCKVDFFFFFGREDGENNHLMQRQIAQIWLLEREEREAKETMYEY